MNPGLGPPGRVYAGLFMMSLATLAHEILLTRIFSVTMWYHFAFVAISVAMFGMTAGALIVYLHPEWFPAGRVAERLTVLTLLFSATIVLSFLAHLAIPFLAELSLAGVASVAATYLVIAVPFVFSGIGVATCLSAYPEHAGKLYAVDLAGAALGCAMPPIILVFTDGPTAIFAVAALGTLAALLFAGPTTSRGLRRGALISAGLLVAFVAGHTLLVVQQRPLLRLIWVKGQADQPQPLYEKWNSFSRILVFRPPAAYQPPFGWGLSTAYRRTGVPPAELGLAIDAGAATVLTAFDGALPRLDYLKFDVTNLAHYLRPDSTVLVVGTGGGRDVLSALVFGQRSVLGIEVNEDILDIVNRRFGEFTGHLATHPRVRFVNDEARSYVARQGERFDIIQISLIDTWAATAAGAYAFTENALYTIEADSLFLRRLTPTGILSISRWYSRDHPAEMYRLAALGAAALRTVGVADPREHLMIVGRPSRPNAGPLDHGVGTILMSRAPFSSGDVATLEGVATRLGFDVVLSPRASLDSMLERIVAEPDRASLASTWAWNLSPPTDDTPFFFHMLPLRKALTYAARSGDPLVFNATAVVVLTTLLMTVLSLTLLCVVGPLLVIMRRAPRAGGLPLCLFFAAIGFGFMLVEISQMQRFAIFLGHPSYSLYAVLLPLLLATGFGSFATKYAGPPRRLSSTAMCLAILGVLVAFGLLTPRAIHAFQAATTPVRVFVAAAILVPIGMLMGTAFPLGIGLASRSHPALIPWLYGINGACSVCASVVAVAIALSFGISAAFWTGAACYAFASLVLAAARLPWASSRGT